MPEFKRAALRVAVSLRDRYDTTMWRLRRARGIGPVHLLPYLGHGTGHTIFLRGRAMDNLRFRHASAYDSTWLNFRNTLGRFRSRGLPAVQVRARVGASEQVVTTDADGYFNFCLETDPPLPPGHHNVDLDLVEFAHQPGAHTLGRVVVPSSGAQFGLISDLDDSVIQTGVMSKLRMLRNTFFYNAHTRLTFPGVPEFYRALRQGTQGSENPIFYVSASPWPIYDMLVDFLKLKNIPLGPMFLLQLGLSREHFLRPEPVSHKLDLIRSLLDRYPALPFIFKGDSIEEDPDIYLQIIREYPGRVLACYIRDVNSGARDRELRAIIDQARAAGSEMLLVRDTCEAAEHAVAHGFIARDTLGGIRAACAAQA